MRQATGSDWTRWLAGPGIVALEEIDTRALVLRLRERGAMRAAAVAGDASVERGARRRPRAGRRWPAARSSPASRRRSRTASAGGDVERRRPRLRLQALDRRPPRCRGRRGDRLPARRRTPTRPRRASDGVLLSNGPGDPAALADGGRRSSRACSAACRCSASASATSCSRCAAGFETFKLPFGHRGANHPVLERARAASSSRARTTASRCEGDGPEPSRTSRSTTAPSRARAPGRAARPLGAVPPRGGPRPARRLADRSRAWVRGAARYAEAA